jgi:hypothetical protein
MFKRIKKLENEVKELKNQLYENLDNQRIKELSKKYNIKIKIVETLEIICFNFKKSYLLKINNKLLKSEINNKHEYIQSNEFERDIKAFLYKSIKGGIKMASVTQCDVCGNIVKNENSKRVKIYDVDVLGHICGCLVNKDICLNCYEKIKKILKIK